MEYYNYIKSLHLIFVITWFAGLFYEPRLFIYHIEASKKDSPEKDILEKQLKIMARRLWYFIAWPSAILASIFAIWLLILVPGWIEESWMRVKVIFVFLLFAYHFKTHQIFLQLQKDKINYSSYFMRIWNEGATLFLFVIVFLAILKNAINWIFVFLGALFLVIILILLIRLYRVLREKSNPTND
jgi:putative membrane protein